MTISNLVLAGSSTQNVYPSAIQVRSSGNGWANPSLSLYTEQLCRLDITYQESPSSPTQNLSAPLEIPSHGTLGSSRISTIGGMSGDSMFDFSHNGGPCFWYWSHIMVIPDMPFADPVFDPHEINAYNFGEMSIWNDVPKIYIGRIKP